MLDFVLDSFLDLMRRGGGVMWLLLALSVVGLALVMERLWFWLRTNPPGRVTIVRQMMPALRRGDSAALRPLLNDDAGPYARLVRDLLAEERLSEAAVAQSVERQRDRLERFMPTLSTIITTAPMLGILGTVLGLISALGIFADAQAVADPRKVSPAIGEALITTAAGLLIAIIILFPYNAFRAQVNATLTRFEALAAAAAEGRRSRPGAENPVISKADSAESTTRGGLAK